MIREDPPAWGSAKDRCLEEARRRLDANPAFTADEIADVLESFRLVRTAFQDCYPGKSFFPIDYVIGKLSNKYTPTGYITSEAKRQLWGEKWEAVTCFMETGRLPSSSAQ